MEIITRCDDGTIASFGVKRSGGGRQSGDRVCPRPLELVSSELFRPDSRRSELRAKEKGIEEKINQMYQSFSSANLLERASIIARSIGPANGREFCWLERFVRRGRAHCNSRLRGAHAPFSEKSVNGSIVSLLCDNEMRLDAGDE